jgi:hypothetical protein
VAPHKSSHPGDFDPECQMEMFTRFSVGFGLAKFIAKTVTLFLNTLAPVFVDEESLTEFSGCGYRLKTVVFNYYVTT